MHGNERISTMVKNDAQMRSAVDDIVKLIRRGNQG